MGRRVGTGRSAAAASRLPRRRQQLLQPLADESATADGAAEQVGIVHRAVIEFLERLLTLAPRDVTSRFMFSRRGHPSVGRDHLPGANRTEPCRWIVKRVLARR